MMRNFFKFIYLKLGSSFLFLVFPFFVEAQLILYKTPVWEGKENDMFAHFVYGLTVTDKGSILAFAEARIDNGKDDGPHHIVLKRSTDQGRSFSPSSIIVDSKNGQSWANPTVVQDQKTKKIFLFYALNHENVHTEVFYKISGDDGITWSSPKEVTALFAGNRHGWTFHLPGPGHGIQLKNKRIIVPVWHRKSILFTSSQRNYGVNCLYSDDHGKTWNVGGDTPVGELNESQVVETKNGNILLIGRTLNGYFGSHQAKVWSYDKGETWTQKLAYDNALTGKVCDIGLIDYPSKPKTLVISQPADIKQRKDLTVRISKNEGEIWTTIGLLEEGGSSYSDLAILPDKTVICLYGHGGTAHMPQKVSLVGFKLE